MNLILDFGNTLQKIALIDNDHRIVSIKSIHGITKEDVMSFLSDSINAKPNSEIKKAILASVVSHPQDINAVLKSRFRLLELGANTPLPISINYKTPQTLGSDRIAAAVAGWQFQKNKPVLIILAGTTITYNFVGNNADFRGGGISPGIHMRIKALHNFTGRLPLVKLGKNDVSQQEAALIGASTEESILSGVINGAIAEMDEIINRYKKHHAVAEVILSGGDMNYFAGKLKNHIFALPNIVLKGLNHILEYNVEKDHL